MADMSIGISGLLVAQQAIEIIGNNIANAGTEGYHRQDPIISPRIGGSGSNGIGSGAEITDIRRSLDVLLELQMVHQQPQLAQTSRELTALETVETALADISGEGLSTTISRFFDSLTELASQPESQGLCQQVFWSADAMASQFRNLSVFLGDMVTSIRQEAESVMAEVNDLTGEIGNLNVEIQDMGVRGGRTNMLCDRRDQAISQLSELVDVHVTGQVSAIGMVNVSAWDTSLVMGARTTDLEVGLTTDGLLGISVKDADYYFTDVQGGQLGGLLALANDLVSGISDSLDTLAGEIITQINRLHVQGVGYSGSFSELAGWEVSDTTLSNWQTDISAGDFHIRVIDSTTGAIVRETVSVDPAADTIADIASRLDALDHISASVVASTLRIQAETGYKFDFLPALASGPYTSALTGTAEPTISGLYTGTDNQIYTATIVGTGEVGVAANLAVEVRNGASQLVTTVNVGVGYAAGDVLEVGSGISIALGTGTLNNGETFEIQALADSDPTGLLAAAGVNALFSGTSAYDIGIRDEILSSPGRIAASLGAEMSDNANVQKMAALAGTSLGNLGGVSLVAYYRQLATDVGQKIATRQARQASLELISRQLINQRDRISGVDINTEAAKLLVFERLFQAMSKVISVQVQSLTYLMQIL